MSDKSTTTPIVPIGNQFTCTVTEDRACGIKGIAYIYGDTLAQVEEWVKKLLEWDYKM